MDKNIMYILEVARCGGITKAAANLYITPSALSKFVQTKEEELQVKLFERRGKKFVLTYAGERYVEMSSQIARMQQEMENEMDRIATENHGRLRIGFQITWADILITHVIPEFRKIYPEVQIILDESYSEHLIQMLENHQLDMAITTVDGHTDSLLYDTLVEGELVLAVAADHRLVKLAISKEGFKYPWISFAECRQESAVLLYPGQRYRIYAEQIYKSYGIEPVINIQAHSTKTALLCVASNLGITVTIDYLIPGNSCENSVRALSFGEEHATKELALVYTRDQGMEKERNAFISLCRKHFNTKLC